VGTGELELGRGRVGDLKPVTRRAPWIAGGLVLELAGAGGPAAYVYEKAKQQNVGGSITQGTVRLVWHEAVHSKAGLAILIAGAVVFAIGAMLVARPFVKHVAVLIVAVPLAAVASLLVLGLAALIVGLLCAGLGELFDGFGGGGGSGGGSVADALSGTPDYSSSRRRRSQEQGQPE
jgi:hypothetical protein